MRAFAALSPMNCQRVQESFVDYQGSTLSDADASAVRAHLKTCFTCQREWAGLQETFLMLDRIPAQVPSAQLRTRFYAMIEEEQHTLDSPSPFSRARSRLETILASWLPARPVAQAGFALFLLVGGLVVGAHWIPKGPTSDVADPSVKQELTDLRVKVDSMAQLVAFSLQQQQSSNHRFQGVVASFDPTQADERTLAELLTTLAFDPSTNVRLCALEALYPHAGRDAVRAGIIAALPGERSPLVQVAMIDFVAAARDRAAAPALEELSRSLSIDDAVREAATRALVQL